MSDPGPDPPTSEEARLADGLAAMAGNVTEAEQTLLQLASALFPTGAGSLDRVTWPERSADDGGASPAAAGPSDAVLRTAEVRYRTLVEQIPAVTFMAVLGEGKNEVYVSPHIEALLGFTQQEWLEDPFLWFRQLHPDDRQTWIDEFSRGCRTGGPFLAECRFLARDGHVVWVRGEARLVKDELGRPLFMQGVAFDITDSKRAQERLLSQVVRTTEERYRDVVQGIGAIFWEVDAQTLRFTFVSSQAEQILGFPSEQWVRDPDFWIGRVHADDRERVTGEWQSALTGGGERDLDYRAINAAGEVVWLHARVHVVADEHGQPRYLLGFMVDVSERRRADEERTRLLALEQEARTEAETLNDIGRRLAAELDLERLVQAVTDAGTELTGADFGAFFSNVHQDGAASSRLSALSGLSPEVFAGLVLPRYAPTFRGPGIVRLDDVPEPRGGLPVRSYLAVPVVLRSGEVLGGLFFGHRESGRFTERHERLLGGLAAQAAIAMDNARLYRTADEARRTAEEANRAKDEFLAMLSHELRTPLTAILGWARMLRVTGPDAAMVRRGVEVIERNAAAQAQLIEDLLDVSRIIVGKLELDAEPIGDLGPIVTAVVDSFHPAAAAKQIQLTTRIDPGAGPIAADQKRLQQVVWNLLSNAVKFTPGGGQVTVVCTRHEREVELQVTDSGKGIPPAFLPRLFDRFSQADATLARAHGGLGLGLAIVRHLVELHGGSVRAESPGEGRGATFSVRLPIVGMALAAGQTPTRDDADRRPRDWRGTAREVRVLLVEDEEDTRALLTMTLETAGATVRGVSTSAAALSTLAQWQPDVLVCDIGLPGRDGYELIGEVRALAARRRRAIPAIALTAYASSDDRRRALAAGFEAHLAKPIDPPTLVEAVLRLVSRPVVA
ncbi:MAG: PAS domain S-box protein [Candidatus Rokuibacteriota bacterium]|nr:MAG: PAS domain S-box protein [Candidatus Rokubacteria bacterium]